MSTKTTNNNRLSEAFEGLERDEKGFVKLTDKQQIAVVLTYLIQKDGRATSDELVKYLANLGAKVHPRVLTNRLKALQTRDIIAIADAEAKNPTWKVKSIRFNAIPEVAHIKDLLPALMSNPAAEDVLRALGELDSEGKSKKRENKYARYFRCTTTFEVIDGIAGGAPASEKQSKQHGLSKDLVLLVHYRDREGRIRIPRDWLRANLRDNVRIVEASESVTQYITCDDVLLPADLKTTTTSRPVLVDTGRGSQGAGYKHWELIPAGTRFTVRWTVPAKGGFTPTDFFRMWIKICEAPLRGLGACGKKFGLLRLVDFDLIGEVSKEGAGDLEDKLAAMNEKYEKIAKK